MDSKKLAVKIAGSIPAPLLVYAAFEVGLRAAAARANPKRLAGKDEVIQFRIKDLPAASWHLKVAKGRASLHRGEAPYPTGIMSMSARTFRELATGRTGPVDATLRGDIHATGTLVRYRVLEAILGRRR